MFSKNFPLIPIILSSLLCSILYVLIVNYCVVVTSSEKDMKCCKKGRPRCCLAVNDKLRHIFSTIGKLIGKHPWKIILLVLLVNIVFGICSYRIKEDIYMKTDIYLENQFRPKQSQAEIDKQFLSSLANIEYYYQRQLVNVSKHVEIIYMNQSGLNFSPHDITENISGQLVQGTCPYTPRSGDGSVCSPFNSVAVYSSNDSSRHYLYYTYSSYAYGNYPYVYSTKEQQNIYYAQYGKNNVTNSPETVGIKWTYWPKFKGSDRLRQFGTMIRNVGKAYFSPYVYADDLRDETLYKDFKDAAVWFIGTFIFINGIAVIMIKSSDNSIGNPVLLLLAQLVSTALACSSGVGLCALTNVKINVFALTLVPLFTQVMGLFRLFLQLSTLSDTLKQKSTKLRISILMSSSGLGVTLSYVFELSVVIAAALSSFTGLRYTFMYIGTAGFLAFINQVTFVPACISLYDRRVQMGLHWMCCAHATQRKDDYKTSTSVIRQKFHSFCCVGVVPKSRNDTDSYVDIFLRMVFRRVFLLKAFQVGFTVLFLIYLGFMIWMAMEVNQQDRVPRMGSRHSDIRHFFNSDEGFDQNAIISFTIHMPINYTFDLYQQYIENLISNAQRDTNVHDSYKINWLNFYKNDYSGPYSYTNSSELDFNNNLYSAYHETSSFQNYSGDVGVRNGSSPTFSRFYVLGIYLKDSKVKADLMFRMRKLASDSPLPVTAFAPEFLKYEQYAYIVSELFKAIGIPTTCFVFLLCLFLPVDIFSIFYIAFTSVTCLVCIFGGTSIFYLHLNFVTMIPILVVSIISVSVSVFVAFEHAQNGHKENQGHVTQTIETVLVPIFKACICIIVGLLCIIDSSSYILYSSFCVFMLGFVNIILHHVMLFPVVIGLFGDRFRRKVNPTIFSSNKYSTKQTSRKEMFWMGYY